MAFPLRAWWSGGLTQLGWLIERYWDEVEYDLAMRGLDLLELFHGRRVRYLLNIVRKLPRNSLTQEALAQDDELVEQLWKRRDPDAPASNIRVAEFSAEVEALFNITDRLGDLCVAVIRSNGGKAPKVRPLPRPSTAWDRIEAREDQTRHERLKHLLVPPSE